MIDALAYSPTDGGLTTAVHDLMHTCRQLLEFEFVVAHPRQHTSAFGRYGLETVSVAVPRRLRFFVSLLVLPLLARRTRAAAVHCEISALPRFLGVPGSLTVNDVYFLIDRAAGGRSIRQRIMQAYWERLFLASARRARVVKTISESTADDLRRLVAADLPIVLCEPPVTVPSVSKPLRERLLGADEELRLLFLGSVVPRRNLPFLLRALQLVRRPWRLDVVGSLWWGMGELGSVATDTRVQLHGYVPDAERERLLAEAHLLVAPSLHEGFGYPAAEAMSRGLPVFASDASSFREFVPQAWRFPLDDPTTLATMIDDLDAESFARMSDIARDAVRRFDQVNHTAKHAELFSRLVAGQSHRGGSERPR
ncbi:MAG: glycosyltransferase [Chloroflexota bacterium]